jgi:hypothetical protein
MEHTFENFQKIVDNAIMVEHARKEMGEQKRKFESSRQFSNNSRPRFTPPQGSPFRTGVSTTGRIKTSTPTNRTTSSSKLSVLVSQCSVPDFRRIARTPLLEHL